MNDVLNVYLRSALFIDRILLASATITGMRSRQCTNWGEMYLQ